MSYFLMSCDRATVKKENYLRAAQEIRKFLANFPAAPAINNWNEIAQKLEENPDCPMIGLWMNSVTGNPFIGEWNDDAEEYDPVSSSHCGMCTKKLNE